MTSSALKESVTYLLLDGHVTERITSQNHTITLTCLGHTHQTNVILELSQASCAEGRSAKQALHSAEHELHATPCLGKGNCKYGMILKASDSVQYCLCVSTRQADCRHSSRASNFTARSSGHKSSLDRGYRSRGTTLLTPQEHNSCSTVPIQQGVWALATVAQNIPAETHTIITNVINTVIDA